MAGGLLLTSCPILVHHADWYDLVPKWTRSPPPPGCGLYVKRGRCWSTTGIEVWEPTWADAIVMDDVVLVLRREPVVSVTVWSFFGGWEWLESRYAKVQV